MEKVKKKQKCGVYLVIRVLITELATHSLCHPAGNRQENNKLITVNTRADYTLLYPGFT